MITIIENVKLNCIRVYCIFKKITGCCNMGKQLDGRMMSDPLYHSNLSMMTIFYQLKNINKSSVLQFTNTFKIV